MRLQIVMLILLLVAGCAAAHGGKPEPEQGLPPGALAFGSGLAAVESRLGPGEPLDEGEPFMWRRYSLEGRRLDLGFYNDKLGQLRLSGPLTWAEAAHAARFFLPEFDASRMIKDDPQAWHYFQPIEIEKLPFEAALTFRREGEIVTTLEGEMNWLD